MNTNTLRMEGTFAVRQQQWVRLFCVGVLLWLQLHCDMGEELIFEQHRDSSAGTIYVTFNQPNVRTQYINAVLFGIRSKYPDTIVVTFAPNDYLCDDEHGIRVYSNMVFNMHDARFVCATTLSRDGQIFYGGDVQNVRFSGGTIIGQREHWSDDVNIRGFYITGNSSNIVFEDVSMSDLSSNGIGIFGNDFWPISGVTVTDVIIENCSNKYNDYLEPNTGPAPGSTREDQGNIAFYHVENFLIENSVFSNSQSDGTHFYKCENGEVAQCVISGNKMGGYFVETSNRILGGGNKIENNGSRGVTIERGSTKNTFRNNVVRFSGREGIWGDDVVDLFIEGNTLELNGAKNDYFVSCGINITDTSWPNDTLNPRTRNVHILNNTIETSLSQWAGIRISSSARDVFIVRNTMRGENKKIRSDAWHSGVGKVVVRKNDGWKTENEGEAVYQTNNNRVLQFPHGLDFYDPDHPNVLKYVRIFIDLIPLAEYTPTAYRVSYDTRHVNIFFNAAPSTSTENVPFKWSAYIAYP